MSQIFLAAEKHQAFNIGGKLLPFDDLPILGWRGYCVAEGVSLEPVFSAIKRYMAGTTNKVIKGTTPNTYPMHTSFG